MVLFNFACAEGPPLPETCSNTLNLEVLELQKGDYISGDNQNIPDDISIIFHRAIPNVYNFSKFYSFNRRDNNSGLSCLPYKVIVNFEEKITEIFIPEI